MEEKIIEQNQQDRIVCSYCNEKAKYAMITRIQVIRLISFEKVNSALNSEDISEPICKTCLDKIKERLSSQSKRTANPNLSRQNLSEDFFTGSESI